VCEYKMDAVGYAIDPSIGLGSLRRHWGIGTG